MTPAVEQPQSARTLAVSVVGVGYVGAVAAACIARRGFQVVAADSDPQVVERLRLGQSPMAEPGLDRLVADAVSRGRLSATTDVAAAVAATDLTFLCVGTPGDAGGRIDLSQVVSAAASVGEGLARKTRRHCVVLRSTVVPGTLRDVVVPALEAASGRRAFQDFTVAYHPEFLREGSAIADHDEPPLVVFGAEEAESVAMLRRICGRAGGTDFVVDLETAELVKYSCNAWHAVKVAFANELASVAERCGVDGKEIMRLLCADRVLNISEAYLRPGLPFGGSCLPKDLRALLGFAGEAGLALPLLEGVMASNDYQLELLVGDIVRLRPRQVAILGVAFKAHTDDLRESPMLTLAAALLAEGIAIRLYDPAVPTPLSERSAQYLSRRFSQVAAHFAPDGAAALVGSDLVLLGHGDPALRAIASHAPHHPRVVDLGVRPRDWAGAVRAVAPAA